MVAFVSSVALKTLWQTGGTLFAQGTLAYMAGMVGGGYAETAHALRVYGCSLTLRPG